MAEKISVELELKNSEYLDRMNQASKANKGFLSSFKSLSDVIKAAPFIGLVYGLAQTGKAAIKSASDFEKYQVAFSTMLKSGEKAKDLLKDIEEFSAATPFQLPGLVEGAKRLLAFGVAQEEIIGTLQNLGNAASGNAEVLDRLTLAYGKLKAKGRASLEEINMFTEAGVPLMDALAKSMGVSTQAVFKLVSSGKVGFKEVDQAIKNLTTGNGQFAGMLEKQSNTLGGLFSTLTDQISMAAREIFGELTPALKNLIKAMSISTEAGGYFSQGLVASMKVISKFVEWITRIIYAVDYLSNTYSAFADNTFAEQLENEARVLKKNGGSIEEQSKLLERAIKLRQSASKALESNIKISDSYYGFAVKAAKSTKDLADKQSALAKKIDITTGSIKKQGKALQEATTGDIMAYIYSLNKSGDSISQIQQKVTTDTDAIMKKQAKFRESHKLTSQQLATVMQETSDKIQEVVATGQQKIMDLYKGASLGIAQFTANSLNQVSQLYNMDTNNKIRSLNIKKDAEIKAINESTASEESKQAQISEINDKFAKKQAKTERSAAIMRKKLSMAEMAVTTPIMAAQAYKAMAGVPLVGPGLGVAAAISATAFGLKKMQIISETPIPAAAMGAYLPGSSSGQLIRAGEGGRSEVILPLENERIMAKIADAIGGNDRNITVNVDGQKLFSINENRRIKTANNIGASSYASESVY